MLKLIYHTTIFGPLNLEYEKPLIRAGSSKDNDLVLLHPSVQPYHCLLAFENNTVTVRGCDERDQTEDSPRYTAGDTLLIGAVPLVVAHSANAVSVSAPTRPAITAGKTPEGHWKVGFTDVPTEARWICRRCKIRLLDQQLKVIGLKNRPKHRHCPMCGRDVELFIRKGTPKGLFARLRHAIVNFRETWQKIVRWLMAS